MLLPFLTEIFRFMIDESSEEAYLKNISSYKKQTGIVSVFCAIGGFLGKTQVAFLAGLNIMVCTQLNIAWVILFE